MNETTNEVSLSRTGSLALASGAFAHSFSTTDLLAVWERGQQQQPVERALTMLGVAYPSAPRRTLALLSIGQRDASLIDLREKLFGSQLTCLTDCPACGERLELSFNVTDIRASADVETADLFLHRAGYELRLRLPNSLDLLALVECADPAERREKLFEQCVASVVHEGRTESVTAIKDLPAEVVELALARIAEADPQGDVEVDLNCPCCGNAWQTDFDIVSYLWAELHAWATQMLREVHLLASTYGWSESDILTMSASRRRRYLEMVVE
jgi:hypothetical protein